MLDYKLHLKSLICFVFHLLSFLIYKFILTFEKMSVSLKIVELFKHDRSRILILLFNIILDRTLQYRNSLYLIKNVRFLIKNLMLSINFAEMIKLKKSISQLVF